jgi:1-deoxy-D-xylulose-5-phosphate reductoisomerase
MEDKRLVLVGATGSIGRQTLEVLDRWVSKSFAIRLVGMSAFQSDEFPKLVARYRPEGVFFSRPIDLPKETIRFSSNEEMVRALNPDIAVIASGGGATLATTIASLESARRVCLANKESLVLGGSFVMSKADQEGCELIPVDSEHSGLFQLLMGEDQSTIDHVVLTASGGALRDWKASDLEKARPKDVLAHPNWKMGPKITVDSATMFNKGLEMIEAHHLFGLSPDQIQVMLCPSSYVHSMIQFCDGVVKMHAGTPDMHVPIAFSLSYPDRVGHEDCIGVGIPEQSIPLAPVDQMRFPALVLAKHVLQAPVCRAVQYNAFNEIAVGWFLEERISFPQIYTIVEKAMQKEPVVALDSVEAIVDYHEQLKQKELKHIWNT